MGGNASSSADERLGWERNSHLSPLKLVNHSNLSVLSHKNGGNSLMSPDTQLYWLDLLLDLTLSAGHTCLFL